MYYTCRLNINMRTMIEVVRFRFYNKYEAVYMLLLYIIPRHIFLI